MAGRGARGPDLGRDDVGAIQVFEAVLVALLVLSSLLIVNVLQRPTTGGDTGGVDLAQLAGDTLGIMEQRTFGPDPGKDFTATISAIMGGDADVLAADVDAFISEVLPVGSQYTLRIANGYGEMRLLPPHTDRAPISARAATTYIFPDWTAHDATTPTFTGSPGADLGVDWSGWTLRSPVSSDPTINEFGPDGQTWVDIWLKEQAEATASTQALPLSALLGAWEFDDGAGDDCDPDPCILLIQTAAGETVLRPLYSIELVVWYGA